MLLQSCRTAFPPPPHVKGLPTLYDPLALYFSLHKYHHTFHLGLLHHLWAHENGDHVCNNSKHSRYFISIYWLNKWTMSFHLLESKGNYRSIFSNIAFNFPSPMPIRFYPFLRSILVTTITTTTMNSQITTTTSLSLSSEPVFITSIIIHLLAHCFLPWDIFWTILNCLVLLCSSLIVQVITPFFQMS